MHSHRANVLICYFSLVHKSLFIINNIEIRCISSNKIENNAVVLFILDTGCWGKASWGGNMESFVCFWRGFQRTLTNKLQSFISSNYTTKYVTFLILHYQLLKPFSIYFGRQRVTLFYCWGIGPCLVLKWNKREQEEKAISELRRDDLPVTIGPLGWGGRQVGRR